MTRARFSIDVIPRKATSITTRLRLIFLLVAGIMSLASVLMLIQSQRISTARHQLVGTELQVLKALRQIGSHLDVALATGNPDIPQIRRHLDDLVAHDEQQSMVGPIIVKLRTVEAAQNRVRQNQRAFEDIETRVDALLPSLIVLQQETIRLLDNAGFPGPEPFPVIRPAQNFPDQAANNPPERSYQTTGTPAGMRISVDLIARSARMAHTQGRIPDHVIRNAVLHAQTVRSQTTSLTTQGDNAALTRQTDRLISTAMKMLALKQRAQALDRDMMQTGTATLAILQDLSSQTAALIAMSEQRLDEVSKKLSYATGSLLWVLGGALTFCLASLFLAYRIIVKRQFNQRLTDLNRAVRAIAAGDLMQPLPGAGQDELGEMARALITFRDTAQALRTSNKQLETFAYVAAHDLRAPLRGIRDLAAWVVEDAGARLPADSLACLTLLQKRARRLDRLMNDLLSYARAGSHKPDAQEVDLAGLVRELGQVMDPEGHYRITYQGPNASLIMVATPLEQIVSNLLSNAIRHHDRERGVIRITAHILNEHLVLSVEDDGPGIEDCYQKQIFDLFQTLRPKDETDSSGIGLSIVKRIAEAQRGNVRVWSDPAVRRGTRFDVTLPLTPVHSMRTRAKAA
jgi:signal transduction histidine kinase